MNEVERLAATVESLTKICEAQQAQIDALIAWVTSDDHALLTGTAQP